MYMYICMYTLGSTSVTYIRNFLPSSSIGYMYIMLYILLYIAGTDFSQTESLVKERHLLQRQLSASTGGGGEWTYKYTIRS